MSTIAEWPKLMDIKLMKTTSLAEGRGLEPRGPSGRTGFRDRLLSQFGHPSNYTVKSLNVESLKNYNRPPRPCQPDSSDHFDLQLVCFLYSLIERGFGDSSNNRTISRRRKNRQTSLIVHKKGGMGLMRSD